MDDFSKIDLHNIQAVLIDIDDTLYSYKTAHEIAIRQCYEEFSKKFSSTIDWTQEVFIQTYRNHRTNVTEQLKPQGACRSRLFAFQKLFEQINLKPTYVHAQHFEELYWQQLIANMAIYKPAYIFLKQCYEKNIPVCAVTDMQASIQIKKLQKLELTKYISHLVTSEEVGAEKPAAKMYLKALEKVSVSPEHTIMIGDSLEKDIIGAQQAGITAYQVEIN
ncbi:MAG: HAD family hydrolase [Alphaproteobacteria bacterium]|nr:HAD family hydrolase [Alphaproteobacteria bacterium]